MSSQVFPRRAGKYQLRTVFTDSTDVIMQQNVTSVQMPKIVFTRFNWRDEAIKCYYCANLKIYGRRRCILLFTVPWSRLRSFNILPAGNYDRKWDQTVTNNNIYKRNLIIVSAVISNFKGRTRRTRREEWVSCRIL